ncbi:MAG: DUF2949 domain-containing protein [Nodosilinea sp. LVE1205-7]|jgi:hypothetical protein
MIYAMSGDRLIQFLREEMAVPGPAIELAWRSCSQVPSLLPVTLWQYGVIDLNQFGQVLDWQLERFEQSSDNA